MPSAADVVATPAVELEAAVARLLPTAGPLQWTALTGGVSSDIWRIEGPGGTFCVKRALPRLNVPGEWYAPVRRNVEEVRWLRFAAAVAPRQVPAVIAADPELGIAVLNWFDPARWTNWKTQLLDGLVRPAVGAELGELLAALHRRSADQPELANQFDNMDLLSALRLEPFFTTAAERHPYVEDRLLEAVVHLRSYRTALIHGDVSPKNVLIHISRPPVLLDAECACWADPAFDVAFMCAHLLLKSAHVSRFREWFYETIKRFLDAYERGAPEAVSDRLRLLAPALVLARVAGKSQVEYANEKVRNKVRDTTVRLLHAPPPTFAELIADWRLTFYP